MNGHAPVAELLLEAGAEKDLCSLRGGADDGKLTEVRRSGGP